MQKKILVLTNNIGGLYSFRKEVICELIARGYRVMISCPKEEGVKMDYFVNLGVDFHFVSVDRRGKNPLSDMSLFMKYCKLLHAFAPECVLTYTIKPNIYGGVAARWYGVPQLANITGLGDAIENPGLLSRITIALYRFGLRKTKTVFYQNTSIESFCANHKIGHFGRLLPGSGVNLDWHTFSNYPDYSDVIKFSFIGRVMKDKGINEFFEAARFIHNKYPLTEFHIFGRCEEQYEALLRKHHDEGIVKWHGVVQDIRPFIRESNCTVLPSYHEGMANVLLESCAAGRPVITCNISGCKEIVDDGVNGYLCRVKDSQDLIKKVEQFIRLPYEKKVAMGIAARRKVEREFDRKKVIDAYMSEVESCS